MKTSNKGKIEICTHEGMCRRVYFDSVGVETIGFGSTKTELPNIHLIGKSEYISIQHAVDLFNKSLPYYENALNKEIVRYSALLEHPKVLVQHEFDAFVSLFYNVGIGYAPHCTALHALMRGADINDVAASFMLYDQPPEIIGRRKKEAKLLTLGVYSSNGYIVTTDTDGNGREIASHYGLTDITPYFVDDVPKPSAWEIFWDWFKKH